VLRLVFLLWLPLSSILWLVVVGFPYTGSINRPDMCKKILQDSVPISRQFQPNKVACSGLAVVLSMARKTLMRPEWLVMVQAFQSAPVIFRQRA
jgi:hypothetical protein